MAEDRKYDLVVFGATGFTGQYIVDRVAKAATEEKLTWAVAGRNMSKLQTVLSESSKRIDQNIEETPIIIADTSSYQSLLEMARQAKVVLNSVGPYAFYGEEVIKACIEGGANHLDISGEPQFLEKMQLLYHGKAKENGVFIIGSTGFESIPTEMGILYTRKQFDGEVTNIECFSRIDPGPKGLVFNTGTMESIVHVIANWMEFKSVRKSLLPGPAPEYQYRLPKRFPVFFSKEVNRWCLPMMGDDDTAVTRTTRDLLATNRLDNPIEFISYMSLDSFPQLICIMMLLMFLAIMSLFSAGRNLLMKFPHIFTFGLFKKGGPTREQVEGTTVTSTFVAHGYKESIKDRTDKTPDKVITTKLVAPEPAYITTSTCIVQCGVTLLKEKDKIFHKDGGVFPPGAIFEDTTLVDRLQRHNIKYSVE